MILDASAAAAFLLPDEVDPGPELTEMVARGPLIAPQHWPLEIVGLLRNAERRNRITAMRRDQAIEQARSWAVRIDPQTGELAWRVTLDLTVRHGLTIYDAAYLERALRTGEPLASNDKELIVAARTHGVDVLTNLP